METLVGKRPRRPFQGFLVRPSEIQSNIGYNRVGKWIMGPTSQKHFLLMSEVERHGYAGVGFDVGLYLLLRTSTIYRTSACVDNLLVTF